MTLHTDIRGRRAAGFWAVVALAAAALPAAGCGSSEHTDRSTSSAATTATATTAASKPAPSIEGDAVQRLPKVPAATEPTTLAASPAAGGESAFLTAVFHDAEAMWMREFGRRASTTPRLA